MWVVAALVVQAVCVTAGGGGGGAGGRGGDWATRATSAVSSWSESGRSWDSGGWSGSGWGSSSWGGDNWTWVDPQQIGLDKGRGKSSGKRDRSEGRRNSGKGSGKTERERSQGCGGGGGPSRASEPRGSSPPTARHGQGRGGGGGPSRASEPRGPPPPTAEQLKSDAEALGAVFVVHEHGKPYTCGECRMGLHRDEFLLLDMADFQGMIYGMCYDCAVEYERWDKEAGDASSWAWKKELKKRHAKRDDVKKRDVQRLRTAKFDSLMEEALKAQPAAGSGAVNQSWKSARAQVVAFLRPAVEDVFEAISESSEAVRVGFLRIMQRYSAVKSVEAADSSMVVAPGGALGEQMQWLDRIGKETRRFYVCRNKYCGERGNFYGPNTDWVHTIADGGWQFACPVCSAPYRAGSNTESVLPGHHVWVLEREQRVILAEWPESAEEDTIGALMANLQQEDLKDYEQLSVDQLQDKIVELVNKVSMPLSFESMQLKAPTVAYLEEENRKRTRQKKWGWSHLADGFRGTFYRHADDNVVMTRKDVKIFLAALSCLTRRLTGGSP
jgi:hypothetical protein